MLVIIVKNVKIKLLINVYIKISRNLGGNFWNLGSNFLAFQWATFQHFTSTIGKGLHVAQKAPHLPIVFILSPFKNKIICGKKHILLY